MISENHFSIMLSLRYFVVVFQDNQVVGIGSGTTVISAVESLGKSTICNLVSCVHNL